MNEVISRTVPSPCPRVIAQVVQVAHALFQGQVILGLAKVAWGDGTPDCRFENFCLKCHKPQLVGEPLLPQLT